MKQLLIIATLLLTVALILGEHYYPNAPLMWMTIASPEGTWLRYGVIGLLALVLFSHPPRGVVMRAGLGGSALILAIATIQWLTSYHIGLIDAVVYIEVAIIVGIEALEVATNSHTMAGRRPTPVQAS